MSEVWGREMGNRTKAKNLQNLFDNFKTPFTQLMYYTKGALHGYPTLIQTICK